MEELCNAAPYEGNHSFAFVCYARADRNEAFTLIETMAREGYRVWYPHFEEAPGQAQARAMRMNERLNGCSAIIALYSRAAAALHDFRKVITAAVLNGKPILPVFLEDFELSCGMRMQIESAARVTWHAPQDGLEALMSQEILRPCRQAPDPSVRVQARAFREKSPAGDRESPARWDISVILEDEDRIAQMLLEGRNGGSGHAQAERRDAEDKNREEPRRHAPQSERPEGNRTMPARTAATVILPENEEHRDAARGYGLHGTMLMREENLVVVRLSTGEVHRAQGDVISIGRDPACDICLPERTVSSRHLEIIALPGDGRADQILIRDCASSNGTWVNGERLQRGGKAIAESCALIHLGYQEQCFAAIGDQAAALLKRGYLACLMCRESREIWMLPEGELILGRGHPWKRGTFDDPRISWEHAMIRREREGFSLTDIGSSNGTFLNGDLRLDRGKAVPLKDGDEITMGYQHFVFRGVALKETAAGCAPRESMI